MKENKKYPRRDKTEILYSVHWELDGSTIPEAIKYLTDLEETINKDRPGVVKLSWTSDSHDDYDRLYVVRVTPETDEVYQKRIDALEALNKFNERREREAYERLKKKFGE